MSSREISELTGKRHPDVMRDIWVMAEQLELDVSKFACIYRDSQNREQREYLLDFLSHVYSRLNLQVTNFITIL